MGKAEHCIKMLNILSSGRTYSRQALAELLETNPRNVTAYCEELRSLGYEIVAVLGRFGGVRLAERCRFPALKLDASERKAMQEAMDFVLAAMGKIYSSNPLPQGQGILVIDSTHPTLDSKELEKRYDFVSSCITEDVVFTASYPTKESEALTFHPYKLFLFDEEWRFFAYCPSRGEIEDFPLSAIFNYKKGTARIVPWRGFDSTAFYDRFGLRKQEECEDVEFYVSDEALPKFSSREYGAKQTLFVDEEGKHRCKLQMQGKEKILSFVLSFGTQIEVISPAWVKEEMLGFCRAIAAKYATGPKD